MKYGSTFYTAKKISTCEIAGAVALCAIHDLRVNLFRFGGFPQILVESINGQFRVTIIVTDESVREESFTLSEDLAFAAAKRFQSKVNGYDENIFELVQDALAKVVG